MMVFSRIASEPSLRGVGPQPVQQSEKGRQAKAAFRTGLRRQGLGSGGIFGPGLRSGMATPGAPSTSGNQCGACTTHAACQAHRNDDDWAARRIQGGRSAGAGTIAGA
jgi:hypothetical protein